MSQVRSTFFNVMLSSAQRKNGVRKESVATSVRNAEKSGAISVMRVRVRVRRTSMLGRAEAEGSAGSNTLGAGNDGINGTADTRARAVLLSISSASAST